MKPDDWLDVFSRLSGKETLDLDDILGSPALPASQMGQSGSDLTRMMSYPSRCFWSAEDEDFLALGIRVSKPLVRPVELAGHLAALAAERGIMPVILSGVGFCGLERFGFRVEDVSCAHGHIAEGLEEQVRRFWNIDIVIDSDDLQEFS